MYELNKMVFCKIYQPLKFEQKSFRKEYDIRPQSSRLERKKKRKIRIISTSTIHVIVRSSAGTEDLKYSRYNFQLKYIQ